MRLSCCLTGLLLLAACHDAPRKNPFDPQLTPPVELTVALDDTAGTATLTWTRYAGEPDFAEYRVLRKVQGLEAVDTLAVIDAVEETSFADSSIAQHTAYVYWVTAVNAGGYEVSSEEQDLPPHPEIRPLTQVEMPASRQGVGPFFLGTDVSRC